MIEIEDTFFNNSEVAPKIVLTEDDTCHHEDEDPEDQYKNVINFGFKMNFYKKVVANENYREPVFYGNDPPKNN